MTLFLYLFVWQLAFEHAVYLVDAVVGGPELMKACRAGLESPFIMKICHDCKRDSEVGAFHRSLVSFHSWLSLLWHVEPLA